MKKILTPNKALTKWLNGATPAEKKTLAKRAKTTVAVIQHYAAGRRLVSADFAQRLAHAGGPDQITLCGVCRRCPLIKTP